MKKLFFIILLITVGACGKKRVFSPSIDGGNTLEVVAGATLTLNGEDLDFSPEVRLNGEIQNIISKSENTLEIKIADQASSGTLEISFNNDNEFTDERYLKILDDNFETINIEISNVKQLDFISATTGFLVSENKLYKTTDGGNNWTSIYDNVSKGIDKPLHVYNDNTIWVNMEGSSKEYAVTNNGGQSWNEVDTTTTGFISNNLFFSADGTVFLTAQNDGKGYIFSSTDHGQTWVEQYNTANSNLSNIKQSYNSGNSIYLVDAKNGLLINSEDNGATWIEAPLTINLNPVGTTAAIHFINKNIAWAYNIPRINGKAPGIYRTINGGTSWELTLETTSISNNTLGDILDIHFYEENKGIASTDEGGYLITEDGGENWKIYYLKSENLKFAESEGNQIYFFNGLLNKKTF